MWHVTYFMCAAADHPRSATTTKVVLWGEVPDVVNRAKFN